GYAALVQGRPLPEPDLPGYFDAWEPPDANLGGDGHRRAVEYWRDRLAQGGPLCAFGERPLTSPPGPAARLDRVLPREQAQALSALAQSQGATLPALLLAVFLLALGRASGSDHPACLVAMLGRHGRRQRQTLGCFSHVAPFSLALRPSADFENLLRQVASQQRGDFRHGRLTIPEMIAAGLDPLRGGPNWGGSFNALDFAYDLGFPGLAATPTTLAVGPVQDINLVVCAQQRRDGPGTIGLNWFFNPDRITPEQTVRLAERYQALLAEIQSRPQAPLASLPTMPQSEEDLIATWEGGPPAPPGCQAISVHQAFWRQAQATPQALAVSSGQERVSYAELAARAASLAERLRELGVGPDAPVGLCLGSTAQMVVGFLGIMAAGGAVLSLEPTLPPARLDEMAQGVGCRVVVVQGRSRARLPEEFLVGATIVDLDQPLPEAGPDFAPARTQPAHLACILHTSGSTGRPKPVGVTHGALAAKIVTMLNYFGFTPGEVTCAVAAIAFDPLLQQLFLPLTMGGAVWVPERALLVDPLAFWRAAAAQGVTHLNLVPSMLDALLEAAPPRPLPSIRRLVVGGERFAPALAARAAAILGIGEVYNMYGPTETTIDASGWRVDPETLADELPIGRPLPGYQVRLLDADLRRVPVGASGEIFIGGMGLARGYLGQPEQTAAAFPPDPYGPPGSRLYRSGDFARWREDGVLLYQGRRDDQVKIRGQRLELGEVETVLRRQPGVSQAAVLLERRGDDHGLVAYIVGEAEERQLVQALARELPRVAVPSRFVHLPALPLLPSGKIDRQSLAQTESPSAPPFPTPATVPSSASPPAGGAALRRSIAAIWAELLGRNEVDPEANLFEMGAHSLLVPRALTRISAVAGRELRPADLFRFPSISALAAHLSGKPARPVQAVTVPSASKDGPQPVAIIGLAFRFPGADDRRAFWANLRAGVCSVSVPDRADLLVEGTPPALLDDPGFRPQQGRLTGVDRFDPAPFGYTPGEAREMDPQQRLLLETAWRALEDAGCDPAQDGPVGVVAGVGFNAYLLDNLGPRLARDGLTERYMLMLGNDKDHCATRLAYKLDLTGPVFNLNSACSTGLAAVAEAVGHLRSGRARVMLAGAASLGIASHSGYLYSEGGIASASGVCRPFDADADGTVPGSGVGVVVLKLLDQALADGDTIHAVIRGVGISNDGAARAAFTAPSVRGQAAALAMALAEAGVEPASIGFVEGHGTGTALGDPIEAQALELAYGGGDSPPDGI
ncbi:MAG: amino acid adenylation domain-containing protein, partial [Desulfarculus sp.]|nr:amino acid adenylation domain-containing protein [Desulfarculus sp.]